MHGMQQVTLLDFGAAYTQKLARIIRDENVYCEVLPYTAPLDTVLAGKPMGLILCGGGLSVFSPAAPQVSDGLFECGVPVLGIGYGCTLMAKALGGEVRAITAALSGEGGATAKAAGNSELFAGDPAFFDVCSRSADCVERLPPGFTATALCTDGCVFAMEDARRKLYGVAGCQAVGVHLQSLRMLRNFLFTICGCAGDWTMERFIEASVSDIRAQVGQGRVLLGLSGGVDSSVCAALIHRAIGDRLACVFVDTGFMRKGEPEQVREVFTRVFPVDLTSVDAVDRFLAKTEGVDDPELKRKRIGAEFVEVFAGEARKCGQFEFLGQGTIYPDIIESGMGDAAMVKSHHNVGGLPEVVDFEEILEPLRMLFKDEVRRAGLALGIDETLVYRQPFPGPGLGVRILGPITPERVATLQEADAIFREEIEAAGLGRALGQYFAVLTNVQSVGVADSARTYGATVALRAVVTSDYMSAEAAQLPYDLLGRAAGRITAEAPGVNRVVYDITGKPPGTIEWE